MISYSRTSLAQSQQNMTMSKYVGGKDRPERRISSARCATEFFYDQQLHLERAASTGICFDLECLKNDFVHIHPLASEQGQKKSSTSVLKFGLRCSVPAFLTIWQNLKVFFAQFITLRQIL